MIEITHRIIADIPVLEMVEAGKESEILPLFVFYHGWESRKERVLEYGYLMAQEGYRTILPEAKGHGERLPAGQDRHDPLDFWDVVASNVKEFPELMNIYIEESKAKQNQISVAGLSMGGITTNAILTQFPWVHSAASLMGSPSPVEYSNWLLQKYVINGTPMIDLLDEKKVKQKLNELKPISLNLQPDKINNRPFYVWHGSADPTVPFELTNTFIEKIKGEPYSEQVLFDVSEGIEHVVPGEIIRRMVHFIKNNADF